MEEERQKKNETQRESTVSQRAFLGQRGKKPFYQSKNFKKGEEKLEKSYTFNRKCFICGAKGHKKWEYPRKTKRQAHVAGKEEKGEEDNITFITEVKKNRGGNYEDRGYAGLLSTQEGNLSKKSEIIFIVEQLLT